MRSAAATRWITLASRLRLSQPVLEKAFQGETIDIEIDVQNPVHAGLKGQWAVTCFPFGKSDVGIVVDEITELRMRGSLVDADVVGTLDSAADRLGHLQDTAVWLADAAQKLGHLQDTASWIAEAAQNLSHLQDSAGLIDDAARNLGSNLDSTINRLESLVDELRGLQHGF